LPAMAGALFIVGRVAIAAAASANPAAAALPSGASETSRFSLEELGFTEAVRHHSARSTITLPLPTRIDRVLTAASLEFRRGAEPLDPSVAGLEVLVNGESVTTIDVGSLTGSGGVQTVALAAALLESHSTLTLRLLTAALTACDGRVPPGAWQLLAGGTFTLESTPLRLPNALEGLPLPFYDVAFDRQVKLPLVFLNRPSVEHVRAATLLASWVGMRGDVRPAFDVTIGRLPAGNALVLADGAGGAAALGLPAPEGPGLRMMDNPANTGSVGKLLVVSGRDALELATAARALAEGSLALRGEFATIVPPASSAAAAPYQAPRWLAAREAIPLAEIPGGRELVHKGTAGVTMKLSFRLPPDLFFWPPEHPTLELSYDERLGPGVEPPRVNLELNGHFLATLPRPKVRGAGAWDRVRLPIAPAHLAGYNELLVHLDYGASACGAPNAAGPTSFGIDGGSSALRLGGYRHFATLPDLSLFLHDGFPFTRRPDLGETVAVLPDEPRPAEIATLLSLVAGFAGFTGRAPSGLTLVSTTQLLREPPGSRDLLIVGTADHQPLLLALADRLPLRAGVGQAKAVRPGRGWLSSVRLALQGRPFDGELERAEEVLEHLPHFAAVTASESPFSPGRSAVFVTAGDPSDMPSLPALQGPAHSQYRGGDLLIAGGDERWMFRIGANYESGALPPWHKFLWQMSLHWVSLFPAALLGVALLALVLRGALRTRVRRRLLEAEGALP
jgi:cellulose synthase (UDP-forming)